MSWTLKRTKIRFACHFASKQSLGKKNNFGRCVCLIMLTPERVKYSQASFIRTPKNRKLRYRIEMAGVADSPVFGPSAKGFETVR